MVRAEASGSITVQRTNELAHAAEIKELFLTHDRPEFPDFFDRAYPRAFSAGAVSWLGWQENGPLAMHIACFPRRFTLGPRVVVGGLLVNMMVAKALRSFFPALNLIRRVIEDSKAEGVFDFLYADPNQASGAVLGAAGFKRVGTLQRYVLPAGDRRLFPALGIRLFHALMRAFNGFSSRMVVVPHPAAQMASDPLGVPEGGAAPVRAYHDRGVYVSRLQGYPSDLDWWFTCHRRDADGPPSAALLVRAPAHSRMVELRAVRRRPDVPLASLLPEFIIELRRRGWTRCQVWTVAESRFARGLRKLGFFPRPDRSAIFAMALTRTGEECVGSIDAWEVTDVDFDR